MSIDHIDLGQMDLNLLVALDALLTERSVTRAAAKTGIGQSAMSSSLARLRRLFSDELLTRAPEGMRPTPRALALEEPLRTALRHIQSLVRHDVVFDPTTVERVFTVALPDSLEVLLVPQVLAHLRREAPGVSLHLSAFHQTGVLTELDADRVDLGIGFLGPGQGQVHHKQRLLFRDRFQCVFNADLLGVASPISIEDYLRFPHVLTSITDTSHGVVDTALAKRGLKRSLVVRTPRFLAVPFLVKSAPVITTMVGKLATFFAGTLGLSISEPPVELDEVPIFLIWHASYDADPAHRWLRQVFVKVSHEP